MSTNRETTVHDYFAARRDQIGTHSFDCWKRHPDCAYWAARDQVAREIDAEYQKRNGRGVDPYTEGTLYGLDIAEQIAVGALDE